MKLWIARDKSGALTLYTKKPLRSFGWLRRDGLLLILDSSLFPSVTWENSPQQVELKLIKDETTD